ncbi:MAG: ABC transporter substrate-binding protein, partial [Deferrisomatales bacterium]
MRRSSRLLLCLGVLLTLALAGAPAQAAKAIKVGFVDTYSGPPSTYTNDVRDAFAMAVEKINAAGGILGRKVEVLTRDDKFKLDIALSMAKELVMKEEVDVLLGSINSAIALALSDFAKKEKVPYIATFAKSATITGAAGHRYVFAVSENTAMAGRAAAVALSKKPWTKYWIAGDDYEYGHSIGDEVMKSLKLLKPGVVVAGETWWKMGTPDFVPYISAIMAAKPDAIILATGAGSNASFLKAAKTTGLTQQIPIYLHTGIEMATLKPVGLDAPEGLIGTANYLYYYPDTPENKAFAKEFEGKFGRQPTVGALYGYLAANMIQKAYEK